MKFLKIFNFGKSRINKIAKTQGKDSDKFLQGAHIIDDAALRDTVNFAELAKLRQRGPEKENLLQPKNFFDEVRNTRILTRVAILTNSENAYVEPVNPMDEKGFELFNESGIIIYYTKGFETFEAHFGTCRELSGTYRLKGIITSQSDEHQKSFDRQNLTLDGVEYAILNIIQHGMAEDT